MKIGDNNLDVELLVDGKEAFSSIIEAIRNAKKSVYINIFIWRDDKIGNIMAKEVLEAANRGVKVKIVKDKLGAAFEKGEENKQSLFNKEFDLKVNIKAKVIDLMYPMKGKAKSARQRENKIAKEIKNHKNISLNANTVRSDHSKYYIIDDEVLIMGGMNIEDKTIYTDAEGKKYNDYMIKIKGKEYVNKFLQLLNHGISTNDKNLDFLFNVKRGNQVVYEAKEKLLKLMSNAKESVNIIMAYIGDKELVEKIIETANRGVKIKMLFPSKANVQNDLNMKVIKYIMQETNNKVKMYLSKNMVHAKLMIIDGKTLTFGSTNFNNQATKKLSELNIVLKEYGDEFNKVLMESFNKNIENAIEIKDLKDIKYNKTRAFLEGAI